MENLRPWRKRTLQIITTERLRKGSTDAVDGEKAGPGGWAWFRGQVPGHAGQQERTGDEADSGGS